jgi:hypothetical protein
MEILTTHKPIDLFTTPNLYNNTSIVVFIRHPVKGFVAEDENVDGD